MIDIQEYIELLCDIVRTPSISGCEMDVANLLQKWMEKRGIKTRRIKNNLWTYSQAETSSPLILLNAHLDTVEPSKGYLKDPFFPFIEEDCIFGLGSNDCAGALVALLATFRELSSRKEPYNLIFSATAGEENCASDGIDMFLPEISVPTLGIIGEPTSMQMAVAEKGLLVLDCTSKGISGHAARDEGVNALYKALDDIDWFRTYEFPKVSPFLGKVKMSVTQIQCGTQHNVIPDECHFVVDVRSNGEYRNEELLSIIRSNVLCDVKARSFKHQCSSISLNHPIVERGKRLGIQLFGSPTTSNQTRCEFPTVKIGPGDSSRSHTADEYIRISEITEAINTYIKLLDGLKL
ncbi:MAG: M20/M25/M40 family metallo-hydrolase [Alistipes sp.]|nr:M20/M25/M40 family metallo-hydrolase [Candidatus Alistipes equi]